MWRSWVYIEGLIALIIAIFILNVFHNVLLGSNYLDTPSSNSVYLKLHQEDLAKEMSENVFSVNSKFLDVIGFARQDSTVKLYVNGKNVETIEVDPSARFRSYVDLRKGVNDISAVIVSGQEKRWGSVFPASLKILYRDNLLVQPLIVQIDNADGRSKIYGMGEPVSIVKYCYPLGGKYIWGGVVTDSIGAFNIEKDQGDLIYLKGTKNYPAYDESIKRITTDDPCEKDFIFEKHFIKQSINKIERKMSISMVPDSNVLKVSGVVKLPYEIALKQWLDKELVGSQELFELLFNFSFGVSYSEWGNSESDRGEIDVKKVGDFLHLHFDFNVSGDYFRLGSRYRDKLSSLPPILSNMMDEVIVETTKKIKTNVSVDIERNRVRKYHWSGGNNNDIQVYIEHGHQSYARKRSEADLILKEKEIDIEQKSLINAINKIHDLFPHFINFFGSSLLFAIPFMWLLYVMKNNLPDHVGREVVDKLVRAVMGLLFLHFSFVFVWLLYAEWLFGNDIRFLIRPLLFSADDGYKYLYDLWLSIDQLLFAIFVPFPPLLFGATVIYVFRERLMLSNIETKKWNDRVYNIFRYVFIWPLTIGLLLFLIYCLLDGRLADKENYKIVLVLVMTIGWLPIYCSLAGMFRSWLLIFVAVLASWAMLFIPAMPRVIEILMLFFGEFLLESNISPFLMPSSFAVKTFLWLLIIIVFGSGLMWMLFKTVINIDRELISFDLNTRHKKYSVIGLVILSAFPFGYIFSNHIDQWEYIRFFGGLKDLLPYILLFLFYILVKNINPKDGFNESRSLLPVFTILFAYYLSGGVTNILLVPIPLLLGAYLFNNRLIQKDNDINYELSISDDERKSILGSLLNYKESQRLSRLYKRHAEKKYTSAEISRDTYDIGLNEAKINVSEREKILSCDELSAQKKIFSKGPGNGPFDNAMISVKYGLVLVVLFQLKPLNELLGYQDVYAYPLLEVFSPLVRSTAYWLIMAFIFGYFYHLIKGRNGLQKAFFFSMSLALPSLLVLILNNQSIIGLTAGERLLRIFLFIYFLALVAFDGKTLRILGYQYKDLMLIYGAAPVYTYASSLVALGGASLAPFLKYLFDWLLISVGLK